ncbi:hypothetical protein, partial [Flavobacterium sp.]|uniref:hypothetical protein n=1 Tax=Flavobacterium sp. TaxID=239 RepID=UPI0038FC5814
AELKIPAMFNVGNLLAYDTTTSLSISSSSTIMQSKGFIKGIFLKSNIRIFTAKVLFVYLICRSSFCGFMMQMTFATLLY